MFARFAPPGSAADAFVWNRSRLAQHMRDHEDEGILLGDSGYALDGVCDAKNISVLAEHNSHLHASSMLSVVIPSF